MQSSLLHTGVSVYYSGVINKPIISGLLTKIENCLVSSQVANNIKKNIIIIAIELLQNIYHHCRFNIDMDEDSPMFLFEKRKNSYMFTTVNLIGKDDAPLLRKRITELNKFSATELTNQYRDILNNGKVSNVSAGLGLIDILRKSGNPIIVKFEPKDNKYSRLTVSVSISLN